MGIEPGQLDMIIGALFTITAALYKEDRFLNIIWTITSVVWFICAALDLYAGYKHAIH